MCRLETGELWRTLGSSLVADRRLLLAVSGGGDSMALLLLALPEPREDRGRIVVGHVHHGTGAAADEAEALVRALCAEHGLTCVVKKIRVDEAEQRRLGFEAAARRARYEALDAIAAEHGCTLKLTAHTRDDQAETVLLALLRGGGTGALAGVRPRREDGWIRPLLGRTRAELRQLLEREGWPWLEDPANRRERFGRVAVRRLLLPVIEERFGRRGVAALATSAGHLLAAHDALQWQAERELEAATAGRRRRWIAVEATRLAGYIPEDVVQRALLRAWAHAADAPPQEVSFTAAERERLLALLEPAERPKLQQLRGVAVRRTGSRIVFDGLAEAAPVRLPLPGGIELEDGTRVTAERVPLEGSLPADARAGVVEYLDARETGPFLLLRPWRPGDRYRPLGRERAVKVARALRRPVARRSGPLWVAEAESGSIVLVVGERIAHRARIRKTTGDAWRVAVCEPGRETAPGEN